MEEWGQAQALAGGAARVGGRQGAAVTQMKPAVAADVTALLLSLRAAAGTPGHSLLCICVESCSASHSGLLGAIGAKPSASVGRRAGWAERGHLWLLGAGAQRAPSSTPWVNPCQASAACLCPVFVVVSDKQRAVSSPWPDQASESGAEGSFSPRTTLSCI